MLIIQHTTPQENSLLSTDIIVEGNDTNTKHLNVLSFSPALDIV